MGSETDGHDSVGSINPNGTIAVSLLDLSVILYNMHAAAIDPEVGFEDCERTLWKLTDELHRRSVTVTYGALESALWSSNMLNEKGSFFNPRRTKDGKTEEFDAFVARLLHYAKKDAILHFDANYNKIRFNRRIQNTKKRLK